MRFKKLFIVTGTIVLIISSYWIYQYSTSSSRYYFQTEYNSDLSRINEIIEKVEHFDYAIYLNCSLDNYPSKPNYVDAEILENFSKEIEENRIRDYIYPILSGYQNNLEYAFSAQNSSYFNYTLNNYTEINPDEPYSSVRLTIKSDTFDNIFLKNVSMESCLYINESFFPNPYQDGWERHISDVIFVTTTFRLATNGCWYVFVQNIILNQQLEVVFILINGYSLACVI